MNLFKADVSWELSRIHITNPEHWNSKKDTIDKIKESNTGKAWFERGFSGQQLVSFIQRLKVARIVALVSDRHCVDDARVLGKNKKTSSCQHGIKCECKLAGRLSCRQNK